MSKTDSLHQLVRSLSSSEKRYFKIHASNSSQRSGSLYIELFDALSAQNEYNENELFVKINNSNFKKNLGQNKNYLKDLILKSLRENAEELPQGLVVKLLKEQEILGEKLLNAEKLKKLQKAKELSEKYELFDSNLEILEIEMFYYLKKDFNKAEHIYKEYLSAKEILMKKVKLLSALRSSKVKVYQILIKFHKKVSPEQITLIKNEIEKYDSREIESLNSFKLTKSYLYILENFYLLNHELDNYLDTCKKMSLPSESFLKTAKKALYFNKMVSFYQLLKK